MENSLWSQPDSAFRNQSSLFSQTGSFADGSVCTLDGFPLTWIAADCAQVPCVTPSPSNGNKSKPAIARTPEPLVAKPSDSTTLIWNTLRLIMACSTFQTFVRATRSDEFPTGHTHTAEPYRYRGSLRYYNADDLEQCYVRPRCYAPALGRFLAKSEVSGQ